MQKTERTRTDWVGQSPSSIPGPDTAVLSNLTNITRKAGASSVAHILKENPDIEGIMPGKGTQANSKPTTKNRSSTLHSESTTKISSPIWKRLQVPLGLCAIEDRIYIREFMLRFGKTMVPAINRNHLRELESIGGSLKGRDEFEDIPSWVGESCVKSMILGLLGFLVNKSPNAEVFKEHIRLCTTLTQPLRRSSHP